MRNTTERERPAGASIRIVAFFERGDQLGPAVIALLARRYDVRDAYGPYPVHGLDQILGLAPSRLPAAALALGAGGAIGIAIFQWWASSISWPLNVGGRPWNSWPAFLPITFEAGVLCAGVGVVIAFLVSQRLRPGRQAEIVDPRVTDDRFALVIEAGQNADENGAREALTQSGAVRIEVRT